MAKKVIKPVDPQGEEPEIASDAVAIIEPITERPTFIELLKFDKKEASIKTIKEKSAEYATVVIDGVEDTTNYKLVVANMGQMRDDRRVFENAAYEHVIDPLKKALKEYADDIEAVVVEFKAAEQLERDKKKFIDDEKLRIKQEKEEAKAKAVQARIADVFALGAYLDTTGYHFAYDEGLFIGSLQINEFSDEEFGEFLEEVKTAYTVEQDRIEQERLDGIRLQEEQEALAESNRLLAIENAAKETQLDAKRTNLRLKELKLMGASFDAETGDALLPEMHNQSVPRAVIDTMPDELWDELMVTIQEYQPEPEPELEPPHTDGYSGYIGRQQEYADTGRNGLGEQIADELELEEVAVSEPDTPETAGVMHQLYFGKFEHRNEPFYREIQISGKFAVRIFPQYHEDDVVNGCSVVNEGELEPGLRWAVIKL